MRRPEYERVSSLTAASSAQRAAMPATAATRGRGEDIPSRAGVYFFFSSSSCPAFDEARDRLRQRRDADEWRPDAGTLRAPGVGPLAQLAGFSFRQFPSGGRRAFAATSAASLASHEKTSP